MQQEHEAHSELAIHDLQRRLVILGYRLDNEIDNGQFGQRTAAAVSSFKESTGLGRDDTLDQATWTALKDASMQMGDRHLYLRIPHFRGRDVAGLQGALSSMGFDCAVDASFGPETEQALRVFQNDMGLRPTGILDSENLAALQRLKHIWEGKRGFPLGVRIPAVARSQKTLEATSLCVYGTDEPTRVIANRVANLARATTIESRFESATALGGEPKKDMLLVGLALMQKAGRAHLKQAHNSPESPSVVLSNRVCALSELRTAIQQARNQENRLTLYIDLQLVKRNDRAMQSQEMAICVLDALCEGLES
ncbi:MAG: peptidoglycan-binding protein [Coriobacteriia bacterium]|nr:peptidoglycan-binding protein [Coriobacteriia bacterium]